MSNSARAIKVKFCQADGVTPLAVADGAAPSFDSYNCVETGLAVTPPSITPVVTGGTDGWYKFTPVLIAGQSIVASLASGVAGSVPPAYDLDWRPEDFNVDNVDVASTTLATSSTLAAVKAKTDLIGSANASTLSSSTNGTGSVGPLLTLLQGRARTLTFTVTDTNGNPINLTGKTLTFTFARGVAGGGAVLGGSPTVIFSRDGVNRSPATLGIADVSIAPGDTSSLGVGVGYVYSAALSDGTVVFMGSPAEITA